MKTLRVATYNIHKGVQGLGLWRRLEIHNLAHAVREFDADIVCLQEVRKMNREEEQYFSRWPEMPQADFLAPEGYEAVYRTNAITRHGEHGNAILSRWPVVSHQHEDISDHRFEQRGLLHTEVLVEGVYVHVVVVHLGLIGSSRLRQAAQLERFVAREVPPDAPLILAGDFNDWGHRVRLHLETFGLQTLQPGSHKTFPSRLPLVQLDYVYARGLALQRVHVPRGGVWGKLSDHLPLVAEFSLRAS